MKHKIYGYGRKARGCALSILLCLGLLAGCGKTDAVSDTTDAGQDAGGKGRYLEENCDYPEDISVVLDAKKCEDGQIVCAGYRRDSMQVCILQKENAEAEWTVTPAKGLDVYHFSATAIAPDKSTALFGIFSSDGAVELRMIAPDGSVSLVNLQMPEYRQNGETKNQIMDAAYAGTNLFAVDMNQNLYRVNTDDGSMQLFCERLSGSVNSVHATADRLILATDTGLQLVDPDTGSVIKSSHDFSDQAGDLNSNDAQGVYDVVFAGGEKEGDIFFVNHGGLFYHNTAGSTVEQLINGELVSLGDESVAFHALIRLDDENFMVFVSDSIGTEYCYLYRYDPEAPAVPTQQLHIYTLEDSYALQQAITSFRKSNPDVFIKKTVGITEDNGVTAEDAIKALNTEIMAGKGPDLLVLDGLPVDSYVEKGFLSDISGYVADADHEGELFDNLVDAYTQKDGRMYRMPLRFYCAVVTGDEETLRASKSLQEIADYGKQHASQDGTPFLGAVSAERLLEVLYNADSGTWRTDDGIDKKELEAYLKSAKALYESSGNGPDDRTKKDVSIPGMLLGTVNLMNVDRLTGSCRAAIGTLADVRDAQDIYGIAGEAGGSFALLDADKRTFVPYVSLGLLSAGEENPMAGAFLTNAYSADCQGVISDGFSVNEKAFDLACENTKAYSVGFSSPDGGGLMGYEVNSLDQKQRESLKEMLKSLKMPALTDRVIQELVLSEGKEYLEGGKSLEDAVSSVMKKVRLYVSE